MYLNFIDLIILIGASLSIFLSLIIYRKYGKATANRVLSLLMLVYSLVLTEMLLVDINFFNKSPHIVLFLISVTLLLGPIQYLYVKYLTHFSTTLKSTDLLHFIPFVVYLLIVLLAMFISNKQLFGALGNPDDGKIPVFFLIFNWGVMLQIIIYTILSVLIIRRYSIQIRNLFSTIEKLKLGWLRNLLIIFSACIVTYIVENMLITGGVISNRYAFSSIGAGIYVFVLGYLVLLKSEVFVSPEFVNQIERVKELEITKTAEPKYSRSGLSDEKAEKYLSVLIKLMEEKKPYLKSDLTLNKLAEMVRTSPHHLSEVINSKLNQNFFDFINTYRVEKVKSDLLNAEKQNYTLLALAIDAGFSSKSSFNMIFKKHTGITPSEYKKRNVRTTSP